MNRSLVTTKNRCTCTSDCDIDDDDDDDAAAAIGASPSPIMSPPSFPPTVSSVAFPFSTLLLSLPAEVR